MLHGDPTCKEGRKMQCLVFFIWDKYYSSPEKINVLYIESIVEWIYMASNIPEHKHYPRHREGQPSIEKDSNYKSPNNSHGLVYMFNYYSKYKLREKEEHTEGPRVNTWQPQDLVCLWTPGLHLRSSALANIQCSCFFSPDLVLCVYLYPSFWLCILCTHECRWPSISGFTPSRTSKIPLPTPL